LNPRQFFTTAAPSIDEGGSKGVTPVIADHTFNYFSRTPNITGGQSLQELKKVASNSMIPEQSLQMYSNQITKKSPQQPTAPAYNQ